MYVHGIPDPLESGLKVFSEKHVLAMASNPACDEGERYCNSSQVLQVQALPRAVCRRSFGDVQKTKVE